MPDDDNEDDIKTPVQSPAARRESSKNMPAVKVCPGCKGEVPPGDPTFVCDICDGAGYTTDPVMFSTWELRMTLFDSKPSPPIKREEED